MINKTKITVVGSGYVGMSLAVLLSQNNEVTVLDIDSARVDKINNKFSTVADSEIELFLSEKELSITATTDKKIAYEGASFVIVATPTNYDTKNDYFDTSSVDDVVGDDHHGVQRHRESRLASAVTHNNRSVNRVSACCHLSRSCVTERVTNQSPPSS